MKSRQRAQGVSKLETRVPVMVTSAPTLLS